MTLHIVDVSRFQVERPDPLDLAIAKVQGFAAINIALDRGRSEDVLPAWASTYAEGARSIGLQVCTYRWVDNRLPGAESARRAYERIVALGGPAGMAHAADIEDDATERIARDYVTTMQQLLGRPIAIYSADWWWTSRNWRGADWTPYLWGAPNDGYLPEYPGDSSPAWTAGWGGWQFFSALQYAVTPLPMTGKCSLSAVRDPTVWATLTGGSVAQSPEYPDLPFVRPKAYGTGRDGKAVRYLVVHYTAGSETRTSAEDGAAYDARRTDGTSCHYMVDQDSVVQEVRTKDRSNSAFSKGNRLGIHYEFCGTAQTRGQWLDPASRATIRNAARQMARDAAKYGIPIRRLSVSEVRRAWYEFPNGPKGIVGHVDITRAYPEDGGTHTDPGEAFPWDVLLADINSFMGATPTSLTGGTNVLSLINHKGDIFVADGMDLRSVANGAQYANILKAAKAGFTGPWANVVDGLPRDIQVDDPDDLASYGALPAAAGKAVDVPGGEQLAAVVAAAIDSRIPAIVKATNDDAAERGKE